MTGGETITEYIYTLTWFFFSFKLGQRENGSTVHFGCSIYQIGTESYTDI